LLQGLLVGIISVDLLDALVILLLDSSQLLKSLFEASLLGHQDFSLKFVNELLNLLLLVNQFLIKIFYVVILLRSYFGPLLLNLLLDLA